MANEELTCMKYCVYAFRGFAESLIRGWEEQRPLTFPASNFKDHFYVWSHPLDVVAFVW